MSNSEKNKTPLLKIRGLKIQGFSDERWHEIIKGVDLTLNRGEVLGLIGESGAGKSTLGLAAMGYTQPGCRITGGSIYFEGIDLTQLSDEKKRSYWGNRMTYVAQSAAASFNPAHRLIEQTTIPPFVLELKTARLRMKTLIIYMMHSIYQIQARLEIVTLIKYRVANSNGS